MTQQKYRGGAVPTIQNGRVKLAVQEARPVGAISKTILKKPGKPVGKEAKLVAVLLSNSE
ncbi:MAG: hypothetical protein K0R96_3342 [Pantoea agglomerans]|nr:hypothetical protein [Pantoea agglomerans]